MKRNALSAIVLLSFAGPVVADGTPALDPGVPDLSGVQIERTSNSVAYTVGETYFRVSYESGSQLMVENTEKKELKVLNASGAKETLAEDLCSGNTIAYAWTRQLPRSKKMTQGMLVMRLHVAPNGHMAIVTSYGSWPTKDAKAMEAIFRKLVAENRVVF